MQVDWTVGQVLKAIDDNNIVDNTLVIFTTDNGCSPAAKIPELEAAGHDQNYIYREQSCLSAELRSDTVCV